MNPFKIFAKTKPVPKATETFTYNAPATPAVKEIQMSFLSAIGSDIKKVFTWLGSPKGQAVITAGEGLVEDVFPQATGVINLANSWLTEIIKEEALAAGAASQTGSGAVKAASVIATVTPSVLAFATANKLPTPTAAQLQVASNGLVAFLNAFSAPVAPAA